MKGEGGGSYFYLIYKEIKVEKIICLGWYSWERVKWKFEFRLIVFKSLFFIYKVMVENICMDWVTFLYRLKVDVVFYCF